MSPARLLRLSKMVHTSISEKAEQLLSSRSLEGPPGSIFARISIGERRRARLMAAADASSPRRVKVFGPKNSPSRLRLQNTRTRANSGDFEPGQQAQSALSLFCLSFFLTRARTLQRSLAPNYQRTANNRAFITAN